MSARPETFTVRVPRLMPEFIVGPADAGGPTYKCDPETLIAYMRARLVYEAALQRLRTSCTSWQTPLPKFLNEGTPELPPALAMNGRKL